MSSGSDTRGQDAPALLWSPPEDRSATRLGQFTAWLEARHGVRFAGYDDLWRWSVEHLGTFWADVAEFFGVAAGLSAEQALADDSMPGAVWFPGVRVNFAEHLLAALDDDRVALAAHTEDGGSALLTGAELRRQVGALAASLRRLGVEPGDRVAAYLPNTQHAVVAFLATAFVGAVWTVCAPDFGVRSVLDRLAQTRPRVLVAADGHHFGGKRHDRTAAALEILGELPTVETCVWVDHLHPGRVPEPPEGRAVVRWADLVAGEEEPECASLAFEHPLWILFSSGTTGIPKGIVHGHGGMLLEQYKNMLLQTDVRPGDVFYWYTSTAWMMWNIVVCSLLGGATAVLYDGSPTYPDLDRQWALAQQWNLTHFGTSAGYLTACAVQGLRPGDRHDLSRVRFIGSTGSPLPARTARWVYDAVGAGPQLVSSTGGTDVATGFLGATPMHPVWAGELSGPMLGVAVASWDEAGRPATGRDGELVVTAPMPSMPLRLWSDPGGSRYSDAYFSTYPGVWRHGDWVEITERGSAVVSGRSDSTLNRGGVRMGTADVYAAVEPLPEVVDCMMIGVEQDDGGYWMPLFVQLADGAELDDKLRRTIREAIARNASPRHVPDDILAVPGIPRTRTGKRVEVPVKRLFQGVPAERAASAGSLVDPAVIEHYAAIARARHTENGRRDVRT
ncbi:acetoacetate--CoA ligase [Actinomadura geliboluensis]|uniref:Acetoacetate--CoA ligase n=1 Tax=Actinomadura geliboluensis TaxID=882440 RepID=A0A5S4H6B3_9ACTN|nr:acetoacetate--CoA ligase [Actinomadura geliboluensis]